MARMYEMNLVIRLQDRASARMRRISGDMSALARHAQSQNKLMQMQAQSQRLQIKQGQSLTNLRSLEAKDGEKRLANLAAQSKLTAQLARQEAAMNKTRRARGEIVQRTIPYQSREKFIRLESEAERQQWIKKKGYNRAEQAMLYDYLALRSREYSLLVKNNEQLAAEQRILASTIAEQKILNEQIEKRIALNAQAEAQAARYGTGRKAAHAGSLAFMGGAVGLGLSALAAGSYSSFDVRATKAATQLGGTNLQVGAAIAQTKRLAQELEVAILGLAKLYPATAQEMADASYNIFSSMDLGASAVERMKNGVVVLTEANKAAQGGQVDLATATDTLITVFNDFLPATTNLSTALGKKELSKSMAELFSIVRFMRGGFQELSAGMNKLAPAAKQSKQSLIEVGAAFAVVTQAIPSAAQASTAEARLLDLFGTEQFITGMKKAGASITVMKNGSEQLIPLYDILDKIISLDPSLMLGGPKLTQFVKEITQFGSDTGKGGSKGLIQMQRALTILVTQHYKHRNILHLATQDVSEYDKSVKALADTADQKYKTAINNLKVAWIQFGQAVMPTLLMVLNAFTRAFSIFTNLSKNQRETIGFLVVISGLLLTLGGLFSSAFGGVTMVLATMRLRKIEQAIKDVEVAQRTLNATNVEAKAGWLSWGKSLLKVVGWIGVVTLSYETLKGVISEFNDRDIHGNFAQKVARGWGSQFKSAEGFAAGIIDSVAGTNLKKQSDEMWEAVFDSTPSIFGKSTMKQSQNDIDKLTDAQKEAAAAAVKAGNSKLDAIIKLNNAATASDKKLADYEKSLAKETTRARQEALKQQKSDVESAAKNLLSKYKELEAANTSAIGGILSGPISGGPVLGAFSGINQTLMGLGVKPIKVPLEFIMQDATAQEENFKLWRGGLEKLSKKLPPEMIVDLRAAGIGKLPEILSLADASPAFLAQYKKVWSDTKAARDAATKADMDSTLALWNSYGKDVAWQIVNGLVDSGAEAKMYDSFSKMITTTFAGQLTKSMNDAVAQSIQDWKESNPRPKVTAPATAKQDAWALNTIWQEMHPSMTAAEYSANQRSHGWYESSNPNLQMKISPNFRGGGGKGKGGGGGGAWATGGIIPGSGNRDSVPAMLTPGEVVLNKRQVANASAMLGTANHPQAVFNKVQHFAKGGVAAAQNYMHMKGVSFQQDPKSGAISVINGAGVRYRTFQVGQPGWKELNRETVQLPTQSLAKDLLGIAKSFTNEGLKQQGRDAWEGVRHPLRRLKSGGQMVIPAGGKIRFAPGTANFEKAKILGSHTSSRLKAAGESASTISRDTTQLLQLLELVKWSSSTAEISLIRKYIATGQLGDAAFLLERNLSQAAESSAQSAALRNPHTKEWNRQKATKKRVEAAKRVARRLRDEETGSIGGRPHPTGKKLGGKLDTENTAVLQQIAALAAERDLGKLTPEQMRANLDQYKELKKQLKFQVATGGQLTAAELSEAHAIVAARKGGTEPKAQAELKRAATRKRTKWQKAHDARNARDLDMRDSHLSNAALHASRLGSEAEKTAAVLALMQGASPEAIASVIGKFTSSGFRGMEGKAFKYRGKGAVAFGNILDSLERAGKHSGDVTPRKPPSGQVHPWKRGPRKKSSGPASNVEALLRLAASDKGKKSKYVQDKLKQLLKDEAGTLGIIKGGDFSEGLKGISPVLFGHWSGAAERAAGRMAPLQTELLAYLKELDTVPDSHRNYIRPDGSRSVGKKKMQAQGFYTYIGKMKSELSNVEENLHLIKTAHLSNHKSKSLWNKLKSETGTLGLSTGDNLKFLSSRKVKRPGELEKLITVMYENERDYNMDRLKNVLGSNNKKLGHSIIQFTPNMSHVSHVGTFGKTSIKDLSALLKPALDRWYSDGIPISADVVNLELGRVIRLLNKRSPGMFTAATLKSIKQPHPPFPEGFKRGGWVKGRGNNDTVPAWLTPGEYVVSKPMINSLTGRNANAATTHSVTHETNINVDVTNPTGQAIVDALNPVLFGLRHKP